MRELTSIETVYLCVGMLLCLVLPLMLSAYAPQNLATRKSCTKIVWSGQMLLAIAGLVILFSAPASLYVIMIAAIGYFGCAVLLRRRLSAN